MNGTASCCTFQTLGRRSALPERKRLSDVRSPNAWCGRLHVVVRHPLSTMALHCRWHLMPAGATDYAVLPVRRLRSAPANGVVRREMPQSLATSPTIRPSPITVRTALYICSVTLISFMAGECRVGTEVDVANQPKVCSTAAEGVLSPSSRTCTNILVLAQGIEP